MSEPRDPRADEVEPAETEPAEIPPTDSAGDADDESAEEQPEAGAAAPGKAPAESDWQRRRRLAAVFGDVLPETTGDEREPGEDGSSDDWLRRQVPPHHG